MELLTNVLGELFALAAAFVWAIAVAVLGEAGAATVMVMGFFAFFVGIIIYSIVGIFDTSNSGATPNS